MSDHSKIEWTDATWNPVRGCSKISPGCMNCYAETFAERFRGVPGHPSNRGLICDWFPTSSPILCAGELPNDFRQLDERLVPRTGS